MEQDKFITWKGPNNCTIAHSKHLRLLISGATLVSMVIFSPSLSSEPPLFPILKTHFHLPMHMTAGRDKVISHLLGLVPWVHQMLIDAERPLNLPMGDRPLVNYFIMTWQCWSTLKLRGVLLPAQHSNLDNLVNKGHCWACHCWI